MEPLLGDAFAGGRYPAVTMDYNNKRRSLRVPCRDDKRRTIGTTEFVENCEPASNEVSAEAEESPLLEAVTRKILVKSQRVL
jgi:hypothetical protein